MMRYLISFAQKTIELIILNAIGSDSRIGNKFLKYGYGFVGPCLPRDNRALSYYAEDLGINAIISNIIDKANRNHLDYQVDEFCKNNNTDKKEMILHLAILYCKSGMIPQ